MHTPIDTNWTVITGAPCSGKTTIFSHLQADNFQCCPEPGTIFIEKELAAGKTLTEICADQLWLQTHIADTALDQEHELDVTVHYILDRSVADTLAYSQLYNLSPATFLEKSKTFKYKHIFILDPLPFQRNHVRIEKDTATAKKIDVLLEKSYRELGYTPIRIPAVGIDQRIEIIKNSIN